MNAQELQKLKDSLESETCSECSGKGGWMVDEGHPGDGFLQPPGGPTGQRCYVCKGKGRIVVANPDDIAALFAIAERTSSAGSAVVMSDEKIAQVLVDIDAISANAKERLLAGHEITVSMEELSKLCEKLAAASPVAAKPVPVAQEPDEESAEDGWRRLALQFDGHRMQALGHLRAMLNDAQTHAAIAEAFLNAPPLNGEAVLAQRIAALYTAPQATAQSEWDAVPQRWNDLYVAVAHLMAQLGAHGEIDAQSDHAGTVMNALHALDGGTVCKRALELHEKAHMPLFQATESALREYGAPSAPAQPAPVADSRDAARFVFEHTESDAMYQIELDAFNDESSANNIEWWRKKIDAAMSSEGGANG